MTDKPENVVRVLKKVGFSLLREGHRHTLWRRGDAIVPVPRHSGDLRTGTFHKILRDAGLTLEEYLELR